MDRSSRPARSTTTSSWKVGSYDFRTLQVDRPEEQHPLLGALDLPERPLVPRDGRDAHHGQVRGLLLRSPAAAELWG